LHFAPGDVRKRARQEGTPLTDQVPSGSIHQLDELEHSAHSHEFVGAEHGDIPFSIILVHSQPGVGPKLHRHPYAEVFIVESGRATFQIGARTIAVDEGHIVVSPPGEAHGFTNTGEGELRLTAIHGASRFETEWLAGPDPTWESRAKG
jgi:mannose-6-phosphate isomerase-like protein (cupin superfamily)